jgi:hypothetical protein
MIVRILGEGQYEVPDSHLDSLNEHDAVLTAALHAEDEAAFRAALAAMLGDVRNAGQQLPDDELVPSDLVLPGATATVEEVALMLGDDGLVPG